MHRETWSKARGQCSSMSRKCGLRLCHVKRASRKTQMGGAGKQQSESQIVVLGCCAIDLDVDWRLNVVVAVEPWVVVVRCSACVCGDG